MSREMKLFSISNERPLALKIAENLGVSLCKMSLQRFSDGEVKVSIEESVRGKNCYLLQSMNRNVNERMMELLIMIDALKRASAHQITVVMPYYGYSRQNQKARCREPITAKLVADLISRAGATRLISVDLYAAQIQGFFDIPIDHISAVPLITEELLKKYGDKDTVIVAPDHKGVGRARRVAEKMQKPIAILNRKSYPYEKEIINIIGEVRGKTAIVVDDIIDTGLRAMTSAEKLLEAGALEVIACATHAVLVGDAAKRLADSKLKEIIVTDAIDIPLEKQFDRLEIISIGAALASAISGVQENRSLHPLF
ncbi:ribose-phosphate pyrophosphokinase [Listeria sp. PSOL-1]|uniref:ribose-phosphate diphosphokinase n=1 Tax=Listeria sp. PSOL-1 TaxID=1844999 RepID=UPI0013D2EA16|nr:ribose-phosphate pyrophosphokinase [Listeria sp. PSOL-1]